MDKTAKNKLKHDFLNSIVIIKSLSKSANSFVEKISSLSLGNTSEITPRQIELFQRSMDIIRDEASKIDKYFHQAFND